MLIKYSARSFGRYLIMNLLTVIQLAAVLTMTAFSVSAVSLRLSRYTPFKDEFTSSGRVALIGSFAHNGELNGDFKMINTSEEMSAYLTTEIKALGIHMCDAYIDGRNDIVIRSADDEIVKRYVPALSEGDWFADSGICAAVTENSGLHLEDTLTVCYCTADGTEKTLEAAVTAVIKKDAKLAGFSGDNDGPQKDTFELFYRSADEQNGKAAVLLRESDMPEDMVRSYTGTLLMNYSNADEKLITEKLSACGANYSINMTELDKIGRRYLSEQLYELVPLIVILCIMTLVGSISTSALSTREQLRDYSVFTLCGSRKNSCILIGLIQSIMALLLAALTALSAGAMLMHIFPGRFYFRPDLLMLLSEGIIAVLFIAVSLGVPALMIGRSSVKELLDAD